jgi:hypothetical protein
MAASFGGKLNEVWLWGLAPQILQNSALGDAVRMWLAGKTSPRTARSMKIGRQRCASASLGTFWNGQVLCLQQKRHALNTQRSPPGCGLAVKSKQKTGLAIGCRGQFVQQFLVWMYGQIPPG